MGFCSIASMELKCTRRRYPVLQTSVSDIPCANGVDGVKRFPTARFDGNLGGQMINDIGSRKGGIEGSRVADVTFDFFDIDIIETG